MRTRAATALLGALLLGTVPAAAQTTFDNLTCFKVKDRTPRTQFRAVLGANVGGQICSFHAPARLACVETQDTTVSPSPGGTTQGAVTASFLCYAARCGRGARVTTQFTDPFGSRLVTLRGAQMLCVPATETTPVTTTTTPGAATTTTTLAAGCSFSNGKCTGTCPAGGHCGSAAGTGSCECRTTACGDASTPTCDGFCTDPNEACIFSITGCSCVRVP